MALIEVDNLTIGHGEVPLLSALNFTVSQGEITIILGPSGCGKSTLLKHMVGLIKPQSGDIRIEGKSLVYGQSWERQQLLKRFGVSYQSGALFGSMTLLQNVSLPLEAHSDLPANLIELVARQKLAMVGLAGFEHYLPSRISGGMKKRAGLARALALDPPLLFLDEPSAGLDPITSAELDRLLLEIRAQTQATLVIVSHELDSILALGDCAIILKNGQLLAKGALPELVGHPPDQWVEQFFSRSGTRA